jgi:hypothetical protein
MCRTRLICFLIGLLAFSQMDDYLAPAFQSVAVTLVDNDDEYLPSQREVPTQNPSAHRQRAVAEFALATTREGIRAIYLPAAAALARSVGPPLYLSMALQI